MPKAAMTDYIVKPIKPPEVLEKIQRTLAEMNAGITEPPPRS